LKVRLDDVMQSLFYPYDAVYLYYIPLETVLMFRGGNIFGKAVHGIATLQDARDREGDFIALPDLGEAGRLKVMHGFVQTLPEGETRDKVEELLKEENPEIRLEYFLRGKNLLLDWFTYRDHVYREFSRKWCEEMELEWIE